jgi:4a-hydroxytetrahydrobiopterin dehydratase
VIFTARGSLREEAGREETMRTEAEGTQTLAQMKCVACRRDAPTVTAAEIAEFRPQVSDWEIVELGGIERLTRVFSFDDFAQALDFTRKVGELAENEGHHPVLLTEWGRTTVTWWTHKIKGLHRNDFVMAAKTDALHTATN